MLSDESLERVYSSLELTGVNEDRLVFLCVHGSRLYGTDNADSDTDIKGVYVDDLDDIILSRTKKHRKYTSGNSESKNGKDDLDIDLIELRQFLQDALNGQPYAIDMLFCSDECTLISDWLWDSIVEAKGKFLSTNIMPFIGYCRHQAAKYGLKGSRLAAMNEVVETLQGIRRDMKVSELQLEENEYVKVVENAGVTKGSFIQVGRKYYSFSSKVGDMLDSLTKTQKKYGSRSTEAKENRGIDWPAISHAYRVMFQALTLLRGADIKFPLPEAGYLRRVKSGQVPWNTVNEELPRLMRIVEEASISSTLPEQPDREYFDRLVLRYYR